MNLFISHESALEYWRDSVITAERLSALRLSNRRFTVTDERIDGKHAEALRRSLNLSSPLHLATKHRDSRTYVGTCHCHVWPSQTFRHFVRIDDGIFVSTPEACFIQLANHLPRTKLIQLGYELCGTYRLHEAGRATYDEIALATPESIAKAISVSPRLYGVTNAKAALKHLIPNSASPMETKLAMLLTLPSSLGGFGLPKPALNPTIVINSPTGDAYGSQQQKPMTYRPDFYWEGKRAVCLEYDSSEFHLTDEAKFAADRKRGNTIETSGRRVLTATSKLVTNAIETEKLAREVSRLIGKPLRIARVDQLSRRYALRQELFH